MQNKFTNPATGLEYSWDMNHETEEATGKTRNISRAANTGLTGAVKQQGDDGPLILNYSGKIMKRSQLQQFWAWYELCESQTIIFTDYDGQSYEVQITSFLPTRVRKLSFTGRDPSLPHHYYTYTMTMGVYRLISGDMAIATVGP